MTLNELDDGLVLFDLNGHPHEIKIAQIQKTLVIGWTFYLLGFILNITYYQVTHNNKSLCVCVRGGEGTTTNIIFYIYLSGPPSNLGSEPFRKVEHLPLWQKVLLPNRWEI